MAVGNVPAVRERKKLSFSISFTDLKVGHKSHFFESDSLIGLKKYIRNSEVIRHRFVKFIEKLILIYLEF